MGLIPLIVSGIVVPAYLGWQHGWFAGLVAFAGVCCAYVTGYMAYDLRLRSAGYVMRQMEDGRGVKRWRVGVVEKPEGEQVRWIAPERGP